MDQKCAAECGVKRAKRRDYGRRKFVDIGANEFDVANPALL
jgi:hypothetical protein